MPFSVETFQKGSRFIERVRIPKGQSLDYKVFRQLVKRKCEENGIPIAFRRDSLEKGGFFNKTSEEVMVMYHPEHEDDYIKLVVRISYQGSYAFLDIVQFGGSRNIANNNKANDYDHPFRAIGRGLINSFSGHSAKYEEEINYYTILEDCLREIVGG